MNIFKKLYIIVLLALPTSVSFGQFSTTTQWGRCQSALNKIPATGAVTPELVTACTTACDVSRLVDGVHIHYKDLKAGFDYCSTLTGRTGSATGAAARCDAAAAFLTSTVVQDRSVWDACVTDCNTAVDEATQDTLQQRYSATASGCGGKIESVVEPPLPDDGDTVADDSAGDTGGSTTGDLPVADTGSPNTPALNSALSGLSANSSGLTPIDPGKSVNFRGSGNSSGSYGDVANGVGALGPQGGDVLPPQRYDDVVSGAAEGPKADVANFGGGGSGGGGGGMGGGSGGGGGRAGAGGGAKTSAAAAQLAKQGTNQFWAGGSGGTPAGKAAARTTATALKVPLVEKPKFGPEYLNKGTGSDGLLRLWGAGMNRLPVNRGTQSCRDQTVFCNLENFDFEFKP